MRTFSAIRTAAAPALLAALFAASPGAAQEANPFAEPAPAPVAQDVAWVPLLGCWVPSGQAVETGLLCVRPAAEGPGMEMVSVEDGEISVSRTIVPDDRPRPVSREGCEGTETAGLSPDGERLYLRSELVCEGGVARTSTGVISFPSPGQWLDVEAVEVEGHSVPWVQWYQRAPEAAVREAGMEHLTADREMAIHAARMAASRRLTVDDVVEAAERVDPEAVRALVAQRAEPFSLNAEKLTRLADAGVPEDVIDVVVAVSYPETFVVGDEGVAAEQRPSDQLGRRVYVTDFYSPYDRFYYRRGLYSPWGFWGGYYPWFGGYRPAPIVVGTRDGGGRVVNGRGYSQGRGGSSTAPPSRSAGDRSAGPTRRGSSGSGSVSPSGTRSGSGSSTGRKAKRREGGGGGGGGGA